MSKYRWEKALVYRVTAWLKDGTTDTEITEAYDEIPTIMRRLQLQHEDELEEITWDEEAQPEEILRSDGERTEQQRRQRSKASTKYNAVHVRQIKLNLNRRTDADILQRLDSLENVQGYIKALIRRDMERG